MNILNGNEAFAALMAGKNIMCRAAGGLLEFNDLDQFPATIFALPGYEFCIKRESLTLVDIQFTKPVEPHDLKNGQEIFIVMPTCILRTKYDPEHGDICLSVANGFAQLDEENAKLQLQALGKTFGNMIADIEVKDGFSEKPKKTRSPRKVKDTGNKENQSSVSYPESQIKSQAFIDLWLNRAKDEPTQRNLVNLKGSIDHNFNLLNDDHKVQAQKIYKDFKLLVEKQDALINPVQQQIQEDLEEDLDYQKVLTELLDAAKKAHTPKQANALYNYTTNWSEEQRKPLVLAIHKRLAELNPPEKSQSSLMVRIQEAKTLIDLAKLEEEITQCDPAIHERLLSYANQRRTDLTMATDTPWETK